MRPLAIVLFAGTALAGPASKTVSNPVTFYKDVLPVLQNDCQGCHRPGEAAPFSMLTYKSTRPWAAAMKESVLSHKMPPWFADPHFGKFANDRTLSQSEVDTLVNWADTGAKEGDPSEAPKPLTFVEGWRISKPDVVLELPNEFQIPSQGTVQYQYVVIPTGFTEDKWITEAEARPTNRELTHHIIAFVRPPGSSWMQEAKPGVPYAPGRGSGGLPPDSITGYAPGTIPTILKPGQAKLIKAGSDIVLQLHYTANGKPGVDRTRLGLVFAKEPVQERLVGRLFGNVYFTIPPGDGNFPVDAKVKLNQAVTMTALTPHMHLRGKDWEFRAVLPNGEKKILLRVPNYSFSWQITYKLAEPIHLPAGTVIEATAHFDNSVNNPANPDSTKAVRFGEQSWEEMMIGFYEITVDPGTDPDSQQPLRGDS